MLVINWWEKLNGEVKWLVNMLGLLSLFELCHCVRGIKGATTGQTVNSPNGSWKTDRRWSNCERSRELSAWLLAAWDGAGWLHSAPLQCAAVLTGSVVSWPVLNQTGFVLKCLCPLLWCHVEPSSLCTLLHQKFILEWTESSDVFVALFSPIVPLVAQVTGPPFTHSALLCASETSLVLQKWNCPPVSVFTLSWLQKVFSRLHHVFVCSGSLLLGIGPRFWSRSTCGLSVKPSCFKDGVPVRNHDTKPPGPTTNLT